MPGEAQAEGYARDGWCVVRGLLDETEAAAFAAEGERVAFEAGADGDVLAIHFPHKLSPLFRTAMRRPALVGVLTSLIGPDVKSMQSMFFVKPPGKPGQAWHQDEHFLPTRDASLCAAWIALDDATVENGCLWAHPGSHAARVLYRTAPHADPRFDASPEALDFPYPREGGAALEVRAGDVIFFDGYLLHRSLPNRSTGRRRRALVIHYMNARSLLPWNHDGVSPTEDFRDIEMIAGEDPYRWKGTEDILRPFVRAEAFA